MLLTGSQSFASQRLLVAFLHLNVTALQLKGSGESTAWSHAWEVFRSVDGEDVT